jgi:leucyl aminopeptidase
MNLVVRQGDIAATSADAVVVNLFEGVTAPTGATDAVDKALDGQISQLIAAGDVRGKFGEFTLLHTFGKLPAARVVIAGLGKAEDFSPAKVRDLSGELARFLRRNRIGSAATITHGAGLGGLSAEDCAAAIAEGTLLGLYTFNRHKTSEDEKELAGFEIVEFDASKIAELQAGVKVGTIIAEAVNFCRDLANEPSNYLTPTDMANQAQAVADKSGLECEIYGPGWMREKGMGGLLGVAQGSAEEPRFIVLRYNGAGDEKPIAFVGKGITFDTGGISIKPAQDMGDMKGDMAGGASVIAALSAIAQLKPRINVIGVVPATENMPSGTAVKPGDVLKTMLGKTIEVVNTDAEGRLVLADGLAYAREQGATALVDVATLTGAVTVALGNVAMGAMTNDKDLLDRVREAADTAGEKVWELPMFEEYKDLIKSDVADMKNSGGRPAGSITAAMLLLEFAEETPWVHLDIAGVDSYNRDKGVIVKGASGIPVRTLVNLALQYADAPLH